VDCEALGSRIGLGNGTAPPDRANEAMTGLLRKSGTIILRVAIVLGCVAGICWSAITARADSLFRQDTAESVRQAIELTPDEPRYYMRLALLDGGRARQLLETATRLDRYNAPALTELALRLEAEGDLPGAESLLLEAYEVDRTYLPRWTLANFYLRRDNLPQFWLWAKKAAEMPSEDMSALFQLCWRVNSDAQAIAQSVLTNDPATIRQYLGFLLAKGEVGAVAAVAPRLIERGNVETDRPLLLATVNRLLTEGDAASATMLWRNMTAQHWVVADDSTPNNASFTRQPLPVGFDWSLASREGLRAWPGPSGLEVEFSGSEPEQCEVTEQMVPLSPGDYNLVYSYLTTDIGPGTGLRWQILDPRSNTLLAASPDLSSPTLRNETMPFTVTDLVPMVRLRLQYQRTSGTPRISGMLVVISANIRKRQPERRVRSLS